MSVYLHKARKALPSEPSTHLGGRVRSNSDEPPVQLHITPTWVDNAHHYRRFTKTNPAPSDRALNALQSVLPEDLPGPIDYPPPWPGGCLKNSVRFAGQSRGLPSARDSGSQKVTLGGPLLRLSPKSRRRQYSSGDFAGESFT